MRSPREPLMLVVRPKAAVGVRAATGPGTPRRVQFGLQADKAVTPIQRQGDYRLGPDTV